MSDISIVNDVLKSNFGVNIYGQSNFRIVFSDDQREVRYGEYNEFYGPIFIRTITGFHERKKYPYVKQRWVLERWYPAEYYAKSNIILPKTSEGDYELIYIFEDKHSDPLPVVLWAAELACKLSLQGSHSSGSDESISLQERKSELKSEDEKVVQEEEKDILDMIDTTPTELSLRYKEGVTVPKEIK